MHICRVSDANPTHILIAIERAYNKQIISTLTARPTAPRPKIATVEPFGGFATLIVAPRPKQRNDISQNIKRKIL
jgi:hypothetical protein